MRCIKNLLQWQLTYGKYQQYAKISSCMPRCQKGIILQQHPPRCRDVRDQATAAQLVRKILEHREDPVAPVLHIHAGSGLVCQELLEQGVTSVVALHLTRMFTPNYEGLQEKYGPKRFQFIASGLGQLQGQTEKNVAQFLNRMTKPGSAYAIINLGPRGNYGHENFLFFIMRNMPNDHVIISQPGVEFVFIAHSRFKSKLEFLANIESATHMKRYNALTTAAYLLYDINIIGEFGAKEFIPAFSVRKAVQDGEDVNPLVRHLVKLKLKRNIENILPLNHHYHFIMFLRQLFTKKINRIIPTMEMLVPGCGLRMLALDFTMMDTIIRSRPERFLLLYKHMVHWPEYQSSPLRNFILQKVQGADLCPENEIVNDHKSEWH